MKPTYTFEPKNRYVSQGVHSTFTFELQIKLWNMIDELKKEKTLDYLQVFEIKVEDNTVTITHSQEVPPYKKEHTFRTKKVPNGSEYKVFCIDDITHSTMILAPEY